MTGGTPEGSAVARETKMAETDLPLGSVQHCFFISYNQDFIQNAGEMIFINGKKYLGLCDTWSQITVCHPNIVPERDIIPTECYIKRDRP